MKCAREGCENDVPKGRRSWCSGECREIARRSTMLPPKESPQGGEESDPLERKLHSAEQSAHEARRAKGVADKILKETAEELELARRELALYERTASARKLPSWLKIPKSTKEHHGTLIAFLSDTHFGEVVDPAEVNDYNKYNLEIAEKRLKRFFERTVLVARDYLAGVKYDGIVLVHGGDIVSGDIHDELTQTNELSTLETVEWAVPRLRAGIELWAEEFGNVHNVSVPGNHGRREKQKIHKRRTASNADTHIARLLSGLSWPTGVTFDVPKSLDAMFEVYGYRFSTEHGDQAKGGDGQVGALGPAKRLTLRKQTQMVEEGRPFDILLMGHFHQLVFGQNQGFVMNGSLCGMNEYARAWHYKPERAQQALLVVTPEHGISVSAPVICQHRSSEGW